ITYGTNNEFGFDYLRDNMVLYRHQKVQRGHHFAIVDEVDSILIDEARTPLIISGGGDESTDLYEKADQFARRLKKHVIRELDAKSDAAEEVDADYIVDEKANTTILTKRGIAAAERFFGIENLSDPENTTLNHHINQAIRAHGIMKRDVDYVVKDDQIVIVDTFTGRLMPGRRYNNGLHQAIEAKERVGVQRESKTLATITFQNYFRMYRKLSGMTGTALTEDREFREIYRLDVVEVPTNKPMIRLDHTDRFYRTKAGKLRAIVEQIKECHEKGQPVLVGTISIEKSEELSKLLTKAGIKHTVLNAKYHEKEAEIVAQAGQVGAVTVSTNMAGRGTDIMLGGNPEFLAKAEMRRQGMAEEMIIRAYGMDETTDEEVLKARALFATLVEKYTAEIAPQADRVRAAGGLFILGTERHESRRIDNQLRGRSGRQGDPGESRFYLSFEDDLLRLFGADRMLALSTHMGLDEDTPIQFKMLANGIENAQKQLESNNFERRKNVLEYDDVINQQRQLIYKERNEVLDGIDLREKIEGMIVASVARNLAEIREAHPDEALTPIMMQGTYLQILLTANERVSGSFGEIDLAEVLTERALECYHQKDQLIGSETMREIERIILLRNVDAKWMEHLDAMEELKGDVGLNAYAQRNPVSEFRIVGSQMFDEMIDDVREWTVRGVLTVMPKSQPRQRVQVAKAQEAGAQRAMS
ncbi:MAG: preprotein translocase subunit SecA, partial [Clostridia bacterium]|nr:preprotein translocase subunit SecA [Clostridia bacterium]